jgi:hypothetical protein
VLELSLQVSKANEHALNVRLEAAQNIYNACLVEALRRRDRMRESRSSAGRKALCREYEFTATSIQQYAQQCRDSCWIKDHLGGHDTQTTSLRAFRAVEQYAFGRRGRPRLAKSVDVLEGKEARSTIVFRGGVVTYGGLVLPVLELDAWQRQALKAKTKYCRIVRRRVRSRVRWYVQLVQAGVPPRRRMVGTGVVGLDLGPSTIAAVGSGEVMFERFCPTVAHPWQEQRRIDRAMARKVPGSIRYRALAFRRREIERRLAAERRRSHGELVNRILGQGAVVKVERLSYRAFQRMFGRSTRARGAGSFLRILRRRLGENLIEFEPRRTCLSQTDHVTGIRTKKPLSQRYHAFGDGTRVDRDLYAAWLARFVDNGVLDLDAARKAWPMPEVGPAGFTLPGRINSSSQAL